MSYSLEFLSRIFFQADCMKSGKSKTAQAHYKAYLGYISSNYGIYMKYMYNNCTGLNCKERRCQVLFDLKFSELIIAHMLKKKKKQKKYDLIIRNLCRQIFLFYFLPRG